MKKITALILCAVLALLSVFNLSSCDRSYDEDEVRAAAAELIEKSVTFNEIYWGKGIPYVENTSTSNGAYYEANFFALQEYGFRTVDELKALTKEVFSDAYSESIFQTAFSSVNDTEEIQFYARYYQKYSDEYGTEPECIMVYSLAKILLTDEVEYLFDTLEVIGSKKDTVYVTLNVRVSRDGQTQEKKIKIGLIEEEDGWRLDTPTYVSYNDEADDYNNLQKDK